MIYGGAIVLNGEELPYKADDGDGIARRSVFPDKLGFDPVFMVVPLFYTRGNPNPIPTDIQLGNLNQKIVTTATANQALLTTGDLGSDHLHTIVNEGQDFATIQGGLKGAQTVLTISPLTGDVFDSVVNINTASWNMVFRPDDRLDDVLTLGLES
jgi:hypothetical protein